MLAMLWKILRVVFATTSVRRKVAKDGLLNVQLHRGWHSLHSLKSFADQTRSSEATSSNKDEARCCRRPLPL